MSCLRVFLNFILSGRDNQQIDYVYSVSLISGLHCSNPETCEALRLLIPNCRVRAMNQTATMLQQDVCYAILKADQDEPFTVTLTDSYSPPPLLSSSSSASEKAVHKLGAISGTAKQFMASIGVLNISFHLISTVSFNAKFYICIIVLKSCTVHNGSGLLSDR